MSGNRRLIIFFVACVVMAAVGALGGYLLGRAIAVRQARLRLEDYATRILMQNEAAARESRAMLEKLNTSPYPFCSEAELSYFRTLLFRSEYIKDAGRVRDGKIYCTANAGVLKRPIHLPLSKFELPDHSKEYVNIPEFTEPDLQVISVQSGRSYIVFSPFMLTNLQPTPMRYTVVMLDESIRKAGFLEGDSPNINPGILTKDGNMRRNGVLYATRCSKLCFNCATAYIGIDEILRSDAALEPGYPILSGLAGGLFCAAVLLIDSRNRSTKNRLRRAIRKGDLDVLYQPLVNLSSRRIKGAEALIRWADYDGATLPPQLLVKMAEEYGFVGDITELVLKRGIRDLGEVLKKRPDFRLNINISAFDLSDPIFLPMLERTLAKAGIPAAQIGIELTESSTADRTLAMQVILHLRRLGHYVCIDDFGTGYSSLSYLQDLAVDAIKIDRSFTKAIGTDSVTVSILPQILAITQSLKLQVVVEGIETEEQASYFSGAGSQVMGQGYLFGIPISAENLIQSLKVNNDGEQAQRAAAADKR
jgi:sensor c-di-GMP phosphodiesterase-like protein